MMNADDNAGSGRIAKRTYIKTVRYILQLAIVVMVIYGGFSLYKFYRHLINGTAPDFVKPLSVEGFMPIGALMSLKLWIMTGIFDPVHPAALIIFIAALLIALLLKKSFCGWICPVGAISDVVWKTGKRIFGRNFSLPYYIDYPLRSVKYILMAFFIYVILIKMPPEAIRGFLFTPYWKVADFKLLAFFTTMSATTLTVLLSLTILSFFVKNFWCRYLCPYGALLGLISMASPLKITRFEKNCIHCGACTGSCPSMLPVETKERLISPECIGCLTCVSNCPSEGALDVALPGSKRINPLAYIIIMIVIFWGSIVIAKATGHWNAGVTVSEYARIIPFMETLEHP